MQGKRDIDPVKFERLESPRQKLEFLVLMAALAPSSHNMQPWLFQIEDQSVIILPNFKLKLVVADPDGREFYTTLGTLVGSLKLIAKAYGLASEYIPSPDLKQEIGRFKFTNLDVYNPDYETLKAFVGRHNSRLPYRNDALPQAFLDKSGSYLSGIADLKIISGSSQKSAVETVVLNSVREAFADKAFCLELSPWVKASVGRQEDGLPGYNLGMPFLISLVFPFMLRHFDISKLQVKIHKRMLVNASVYCVICADEETPEKWLNIGQAFIQIAVEAEKNQISIGVMQASIENPQDRMKLKTLIASDKLPQMFFRLGYCELMHKHSPRRPLYKVLAN